MKCQKCNRRAAVSFQVQGSGSDASPVLVCKDCFLPGRGFTFTRMTSEAMSALVQAGRELTGPRSAHRVRPALLYFLLEYECTPLREVLRAMKFDVAGLREDLAGHLAGDTSGDVEWVSNRGLTPILVAARGVVQRMEQDNLGIEHLFLGLIESPEPGDPSMLIRLAAKAGEIERRLLGLTALVP